MSIHTIQKNPQKLLGIDEIESELTACSYLDTNTITKLEKKVSDLIKTTDFSSQSEKEKYQRIMKKIVRRREVSIISNETFEEIRNTPPEPKYEPPEILVNIGVGVGLVAIGIYAILTLPLRIGGGSVADEYKAMEMRRRGVEDKLYNGMDSDDDD